MTKSEVEEIRAPVIVVEKSPNSLFPPAELNESISPESARPEAAMIRKKTVKNVQPPAVGYGRATTSEQFTKLEATEKTVVDTQAKAPKSQLSSAEAVEDDGFSTSEKHASVSPEIIVKRKVAVIKIVEGGHVLDAKKVMAPLKMGGELILKVVKGVQESAVEGDIFSPQMVRVRSLWRLEAEGGGERRRGSRFPASSRR